MKFLIDNAISPFVALELNKLGYDAVHVQDYQMHAAEDSEILDRAFEEDRIIVSVDTDFGTLLALRQQAKPSFILFRKGVSHLPQTQLDLILDNIPQLKDDLAKGCVVVITGERIRIRYLPIISKED